jgi:hypothetical protein
MSVMRSFSRKSLYVAEVPQGDIRIEAGQGFVSRRITCLQLSRTMANQDKMD